MPDSRDKPRNPEHFFQMGCTVFGYVPARLLDPPAQSQDCILFGKFKCPAEEDPLLLRLEGAKNTD
ncbi:MAG: hypothetical protein GF364_20665 [Candidatus Lokiarchaeota archaeon]|nr:hypothetical protein [Candidatus Lokiarchaeota archaeon]